MYVDELLLVSDVQALTVTAVSTNAINTIGNVLFQQRTLGDGEPVGFGLTVGVTADFTTGNETYEVDVIQSANADLSSPDVLSASVIAAADLVAGARFFFGLPPGFPTKRYIGLKYVLGGTTPSVTVTAWLTAESMFSDGKDYAVGSTIS